MFGNVILIVYYGNHCICNYNFHHLSQNITITLSIQVGKIKETQMKETIVKEYKRRAVLMQKTKAQRRYKGSPSNTWTVAVLQYGVGVTKCQDKELKK